MRRNCKRCAEDAAAALGRLHRSLDPFLK